METALILPALRNYVAAKPVFNWIEDDTKGNFHLVFISRMQLES